MAGHSKWANIQHRKGKQDAKRGNLFTKFIREITVAARMGGGDPNANPRLRLALDKAFGENMSKDTVERAIKRGVGGMEGEQVDEVTYEGYGIAGVAVLVECMTNNRNRTVAEVRHAFTKCGGNLGTDGSVAYLFNKQGVLTFAPGADENKIIEVALEAGADDVSVNDDGSMDVVTTVEQFNQVKIAFVTNNLIVAQADVSFVPTLFVELAGEQAEKMQKLLDMLEELDDVQNVYSNAELTRAD